MPVNAPVPYNQNFGNSITLGTLQDSFVNILPTTPSFTSRCKVVPIDGVFYDVIMFDNGEINPNNSGTFVIQNWVDKSIGMKATYGTIKIHHYPIQNVRAGGYVIAEIDLQVMSNFPLAKEIFEQLHAQFVLQLERNIVFKALQKAKYKYEIDMEDPTNGTKNTINAVKKAILDLENEDLLRREQATIFATPSAYQKLAMDDTKTFMSNANITGQESQFTGMFSMIDGVPVVKVPKKMLTVSPDVDIQFVIFSQYDAIHYVYRVQSDIRQSPVNDGASGRRALIDIEAYDEIIAPRTDPARTMEVTQDSPYIAMIINKPATPPSKSITELNINDFSDETELARGLRLSGEKLKDYQTKIKEMEERKLITEKNESEKKILMEQMAQFQKSNNELMERLSKIENEKNSLESKLNLEIAKKTEEFQKEIDSKIEEKRIEKEQKKSGNTPPKETK